MQGIFRPQLFNLSDQPSVQHVIEANLNLMVKLRSGLRHDCNFSEARANPKLTLRLQSRQGLTRKPINLHRALEPLTI